MPGATPDNAASDVALASIFASTSVPLIVNVCGVVSALCSVRVCSAVVEMQVGANVGFCISTVVVTVGDAQVRGVELQPAATAGAERPRRLAV